MHPFFFKYPSSKFRPKNFLAVKSCSRRTIYPDSPEWWTAMWLWIFIFLQTPCLPEWIYCESYSDKWSSPDASRASGFHERCFRFKKRARKKYFAEMHQRQQQSAAKTTTTTTERWIAKSQLWGEQPPLRRPSEHALTLFCWLCSSSRVAIKQHTYCITTAIGASAHNAAPPSPPTAKQ